MLALLFPPYFSLPALVFTFVLALVTLSLALLSLLVLSLLVGLLLSCAATRRCSEHRNQHGDKNDHEPVPHVCLPFLAALSTSAATHGNSACRLEVY
jgi:hypothetical protein